VHEIPILYVTHDRAEVDALGERVITMDQGKIIRQEFRAKCWTRRATSVSRK